MEIQSKKSYEKETVEATKEKDFSDEYYSKKKNYKKRSFISKIPTKEKKFKSLSKQKCSIILKLKEKI